MPNIVEINDLSAPELDVYARLTEAQLRNKLEPEKDCLSPKAPRSSAPLWMRGIGPCPF